VLEEVAEVEVVAGAGEDVAGAGADAGGVDCTGGEYKAAKRFFSSSAVSCFGVAPAAGATGGATAGDSALMLCKDPLAGPGPPGPADKGIPVSAIVGVPAGGTFGVVGSPLATAATTGEEAGAPEAVAAGMGAGA